MSIRRQRSILIALAALVIAAAVAWWTADRWLPHARPWLEQAESILAPSGAPPSGRQSTQAEPARAGASQPEPAGLKPRKCVQDGRVTYTDQPCPPGSQEQPISGIVTTMPR